MVDTTAAAFGMQPATSRGRNVPRRRDVEEQTEEAFAAEEPKGMGYAELLLDNIIGLDNQYESTGEAFGKAFNEDELGTLKNMAVGAYEGAKEFVTSPIETTGNVVKDIRDSVYRLGSEDLDARIKRMYGIGYQDATDEQVTKAREAVIGDAVTASSLIPAARGVKSVATVAADAMGPYDPNVLGSNLGNIGAAAKPKRPSVPRFERDTKQDAIAAFDEAFSLPDNPFEADMASAFLNTRVGEFRKDRNIDVSDIPEQVPEEFGGGYFYLENIRLHDIIKAEVDGKPTEELIDDFGVDPAPDAVAFVERMRSSLRADKEDAEFVEKYKTFLQRYPEYDPNDIITDRTLGSSETLFRSPIESVIQQLEYPRDGIKGAQFLKELKDNPDVRDSEVAGIGLDIDPQKRYTQQELMDAVSGRLYDVSVQNSKDYVGYQYQRAVGFSGPEKDYFELVVNATPRGNNSGFKAKSQHYNNETLVHTRAIVSEDVVGEYIFVQEFQSDLLQRGYQTSRIITANDVENRFDINLYDVGLNGLSKASPEETQKAIDMAVFRQKLGSLQGEEYDNSSDTLTDFIRLSNEREYAVFNVFNAVYDKFLSTNPNVPLEDVTDFFNAIKDYVKKDYIDILPPPIAKTEEAVRLAIDALMAEGQKRNVSRIVIPPLKKIVEVRANDLAYVYGQKLKRKVTAEEAMQMAMEPTSGFYDTYVRSVNKVLDKYKKEFGDDFAVIPHEIEYKYKNAFGYDQTEILEGIEIDFSGLLNKGYNLTRPRFAQGGMVDYNTETQMNRLMQEGGIADDGMRRDPVSGNEVPPGSMAEEVRDDIPAQLSSGEYVVPADVLRYYGVAFFEKLRAKAKQGLSEMEAGGRIGGEPVAAPMRGMEYDDDELDDEDEMMLQEIMGGGMAQGGMMMSQPQQAANYYGLQPTMKLDRQMAQAFQQGGVAVDPTNIQQTTQQFTSQFDPTKFKPGFMFDQPTTGTAAAVEMRTYVNAQGEIRMIPFQNGQPLEPIPEGFYPQGQVPATTQVQQDRGDDRDRSDEQEPPKPYTEYTAEDWNKYNTDRSFGSKIGQAIAGAVGTVIAGPFGGIAGSNLAAEAIARDGIKAYNALNDFIGNMDENNPSYQDLVDKRDEMYNAITEAQKKEPGFIGGILEKIFGKPVITPPKSGGGGRGAGGGGGGTGGGGGAASSRDEGAGAVVTPPPPTARAASAPVGGRGTGATATRGTTTAAVRDVTALEGPEAASTQRVAQDQRLGAGARGAAQGGLMVKKRIAKKAAKKRPIKTTDA